MAQEPGGEVQRKSEVADQMERAERVVVSLNALVDSLTERLGSALRNVPMGTDGNLKPDVALCPLANSLRQLTSQIEKVNANLAGLVDRLEL